MQPIAARAALSDAKRCAQFEGDPNGFAAAIFGIETWSLTDEDDPECTRDGRGGQRQFLQMCADYRRVSCVSGHRIGKSFGVAILLLWAYCHGYRAIFTANTEDQVDAVVWHAIGELISRAKDVMGITIPGTEEGVGGARKGLKHPSNGGELWGIVARKPEALQGLAAPKLLMVVDEASGVEEKYFRALNGNMAAEGAKMVLIGNPTSPIGTFRDSHGPRKWTPSNPTGYRCLWIRTTDSPNITGRWARTQEYVQGVGWRQRTSRIPALAGPDFVAQCAADYGDDSPEYHIRVTGSFAKIDDLKLFPPTLLATATGRWEDTSAVGRLYIGCDPAGNASSGDNTAFAVRRGLKSLHLGERQAMSEAMIAVHICGLIAEYDGDAKGRLRPCVNVDAQGPIGYKVYQVLRDVGYDNGFDVYPFLSSQLAWDKQRYYLRRDEGWGRARDWLLAGGALPANHELLRQLGVAEFTERKGAGYGQAVVTPKEQMIETLGRSPDLADAWWLSVWTPAPLRGEDGDVPQQPHAEGKAKQTPDYGLSDSEDALDPYGGHGLDPYSGFGSSGGDGPLGP